jgi:hypothetical protein
MTTNRTTKEMMIKIEYIPSKNHYSYHLWDGPEGIDEFFGFAPTLGECFEKIIMHRTLNSLNYKPD